MASTTPVWLDCDPGHDDAFAILLCSYHPRLNLLGVSTVHGNAPLTRTTANALSVLTAIGKTDIPVHAGAAKGFCRSAVSAPDIHGASGLDGTDLLPTPAHSASEIPAVPAMYDALAAQPKGKAWVIATGALTNVALLFATYPHLADHVAGLSIMGGAVGAGFTTAKLGVVKGERGMKSGLGIRPHLTHQVLAVPDVLNRLLYPPSSGPATQSTLRRLLHDLLTFFAHTYATVYDITAGPPLHDPVAVAAVLHVTGVEDLRFEDYGGERYHIEVVTDGAHAAHDGTVGEQEGVGMVGRTVVKKSDRGGILVPRGVDVDKFWQILLDAVDEAEKRAL